MSNNGECSTPSSSSSSSANTGYKQQDGEKPTQRPPSYSAIFHHSRPRSHTPAPPGMDPLAAAAWHNKTHSLIHRLPDRVLIRIIDMLDNSGVECMRRSIAERPGLYIPSESFRNGPFTWPGLRSMYPMGQAQEMLRVAEGRDGLPADRTQLMRLLDRDRYCDGCRSTREAPDWGQRAARLRRFLHCSVCLVDHPACLFSSSQRLQKPHRRVCIAHDGYLRICGHKEGIVRWSDVADYERKKGPLQCKKDSHTVLCKDTTMTGSKGNPTTLDPGCHVDTCYEFIYPSFQLQGNRICLDWTAHLPLERTEWPITAAALRPRLAELRNNVGRFICPPLAPGVGMDLPELRCFDPNSCDCIRFEDSQGVLEFDGGHADAKERIIFKERKFALDADKDGLGAYWCRQKWCRNYYGRIPGFSSIIYGQEYSRRCPRACE
ncbi:hypothetical protein VMCG_03460 [Cytospora schulzeri]|uniref:F-box domain-containing protein n=1 Tax=Cytospora schulzeri TaxID=448051 RepID=A0A423WWK8_9PEZI|nr:hypothetical protein VMCG_03460 [Valsa malicola]